ncbi:MAG: Crp/Fnr family transcriptional regulator, partial [Gelidibacter sp.]|nr:Crp/Fnr family transcriptional regulator [Gelidibacter sp.]
MTKEELKQVSDSKTSLGYKRGDIIFDEGELLNGVYCIRSGVCKLVKLNSNGKDQTVKLLGKGELIGQRSIISEERTNLSAVALNDVELCYVPKDQILNSLHVNKDFSFDVLQHLAQNLRQAEDDLIDMAQKSVKQRLAETIITLKNDFGVADDGSINVVLTRDDYASIIGTATESVI